jgi:crossover junction endodeoxyribonuclease RuvC
MRILGIDPGTSTVGWAVIETVRGQVTPIDYGHFSTSKDTPMPERLLEISRDLRAVIEKYAPDEASVEEIFFFKNAKTVISVAEARGVILLTLASLRVSIAEYTPLQVKQSLTGYGRAEKKQVQIMVKNILNLREIPKPDDTADAIALALCHNNSRVMTTLERTL